MINRAALLLRYRAPAVEWVNEADPYREDPGLTLETVNRQRNVYLVDEHEAANPDRIARWVDENYLVLFERELDSWYNDPDVWPRELSLDLFHAWFEVECHPVVSDMVGDEIWDDDR